MSPKENPDSALWVAIKRGGEAIRANVFPGTILWLLGIGIIVGYYQSESIHQTLESLGRLKIRMGWMFGMISTMMFGGLIPIIFPVLIGKPKPRKFFALLISNAMFWAYKGLEVDLLYRVQSWAFGDGTDWGTILTKVLVDGAIYAPTIGLFNCIIFYIWRDCDYSFSRLSKNLGKNWYVRRILPALISNWFVWLPAAGLIYSLPLALQLPMQNLILCFWVLILVFFTADEPDANPATH